jgi:hypothetical protein
MTRAMKKRGASFQPAPGLEIPSNGLLARGQVGNLPDIMFVVAVDSRHCFLYELYSDEAAFAKHRETAHFAEFNQAAQPTTENKRIETFTPAEAWFPRRRQASDRISEAMKS